MLSDQLDEEYKRLLSDDPQNLRQVLSAVVENGDSIMLTDENWVIRYANPAYMQMTGYLREELIGKTPRMLSSGLHSEKFYTDVLALLRSGETFRGEFINRRKSGELYYQDETIAPVRDRAGQIIGFVSNGRDATKDRDREKLVIMGKFAMKKNNMQALKDLNDIYIKSQQMEQMLDELYEFVQPSLSDGALVDVVEVVKRASAAMEVELKKVNSTIELQFGQEIPQLPIRMLRWEFIVMELLHHYIGGMAGVTTKGRKISVDIGALAGNVTVVINGNGNPIHSRGTCDEFCGCAWVDDADLKFILMELVVTDIGGTIRYEQGDDGMFRTILILPNRQ
jgi:PAS domain S-box-containing protein